MATLSITKYSNKVWKFIASDVPADFSFSKLQVDTDGDSFVIVSQGGATTNSYQLADITVYASEGGTPETGWLSMEALLLRLEELNFPAWNESGAVLDFNLRVQQVGETVISNVNKLIFDGATVVNNGDDSVTITITGGGGGVTKFTELTDTPASYTGQASKVVAVKVDESGLEFVAGGGGTTPTLQEVLDEGKTATFTGVGGEDISINMGGDDGGGEAVDFVIISKIVGDDTFSTQRFQKQNIISYGSTIENSVTEESKVSGINLSDGEFSIEKQNLYNLGAKLSSQFLQLEDIAEVDISGTNLDVIFKPKPKFVSGTYYLVDEDYVTNAIAGVTVPDATPTVKGIAKLYTSLGSNTDGAVDQNTVNSALALKANLQNVEQIIRSKANGTFGSHTGDTAETVIAVIDIDADEFEAGDWMTLLFSGEKDASAGNVTWRLRAGVNGNTSDDLIATAIATAANSRYLSLSRLSPRFLTGNLLNIFPVLTSSSIDIGVANANTSSVSLTPTSAWKLTVTAKLTVSTETASLTGYRIGKIKSF